MIADHSKATSSPEQNKNVSSEKIDCSENDLDIDDDDEEEEEPIEDHLFLVYKLNMLQDSDQVLRYCFSKKSRPLFYSSKGLFDHTKIPNCPFCGATRNFEFQINSTVLNHFEELRDFEWGVVCMYSCSESCFSPKIGEFAEEVVMVQYEAQTPTAEPDVTQANIKAEQEYARLLIEEMSLESREMAKKKTAKPKEQKAKKDVDFNEDDWN